MEKKRTKCNPDNISIKSSHNSEILENEKGSNQQQQEYNEQELEVQETERTQCQYESEEHTSKLHLHDLFDELIALVPTFECSNYCKECESNVQRIETSKTLTSTSMYQECIVSLLLSWQHDCIYCKTITLTQFLTLSSNIFHILNASIATISNCSYTLPFNKKQTQNLSLSSLLHRWQCNVMSYGLSATESKHVLCVFRHIYICYKDNAIESNCNNLELSEENQTTEEGEQVQLEVVEISPYEKEIPFSELLSQHFVCKVMKVIMNSLYTSIRKWSHDTNRNVLPILRRLCDVKLLELDENFAKWFSTYEERELFAHDLSILIKAANFSFLQTNNDNSKEMYANDQCKGESLLLLEECNYMLMYIEMLCSLCNPKNNNNCNNETLKSVETVKVHNNSSIRNTLHIKLTSKQCDYFIDSCVMLCMREHKWLLAHQLLNWALTSECDNYTSETERKEWNKKRSYRISWCYRLEKMIMVSTQSWQKKENDVYMAAEEVKRSLVYNIKPETEKLLSSSSSSSPSSMIYKHQLNSYKEIMKHIDVNNVEAIYEFMLVLCGAKYVQSCSDTHSARRDQESDINVNESFEEEEWEKSFCCQENKQMVVGFVLHYIIDSMLFNCDTLSWVHDMISDPLMLPLIKCTFIELINFLLIRVKDVPLARCYHTRLLFWLSSCSSSSSQLLEHHGNVAIIYPKALYMWLATLHLFACVFTIPGCFMHHNVEEELMIREKELSPQEEKLQWESSVSKLLFSNEVHDLWYWQEVKKALHVILFGQTDFSSTKDFKILERRNTSINTLYKQNETSTLSALTMRCVVKRYLMEIVNKECNKDNVSCLINSDIGNFINHQNEQSIKPFTTLSVHYNAEQEELELVRQRHHDPFMRYVNNNNSSAANNENEQTNSEYDNDDVTHSSNSIKECVLELNGDKMCVSKHISKNVIRSLVNEMYNLVERNRTELMENDYSSSNNSRSQDSKTELTLQLHPSERQDEENMSKMRKIKWWQHRIELDKEMEQIVDKLQELLFYNSSVSTSTVTPSKQENKVNKSSDNKNIESSKIDPFSFAMFFGDVALAHRIQLWSFATEFVQKLKCYVTSQHKHELQMNEYKECEICPIIDNNEYYNNNGNDDSGVITAASHLFAILQAMPILISSYVSNKSSEQSKHNYEESYHVNENNCLENMEHEVLASLRQRRQHAKMKNNNSNNNRSLYYAPQCSCEHCTLLVQECTLCIQRCVLELITNLPNLSFNKESLEYTKMCSSLAIEVLTSFYDHLLECEPSESVEHDTEDRHGVKVIHLNLLCTLREHLYLIFDKEENLFVLPWEGLSILSHYSNSRVIDVKSVLLGQCREEEEVKYHRRKEMMEKRYYETAIQMYLVIDPSSTCHLNKYEELMTRPDRPVWRIQHTNEIHKSKSIYTEKQEEFKQQPYQNEKPYSFWSCELLPSNASCYVYIGHRRGEEIISRASLHDYISNEQFSHYQEDEFNKGKQECYSLPLIAMLMSCSSAKLCGNVKCDCTGMPLAFHEANVMCFIGLLWEVTDGEVDKCTLKLLEHIRNNNNNNSCFSKENCSTQKCTTEVAPYVTKCNKRKSNRTHIDTAMKTAQWKCILPFLSSAAFVMYGYNLPLSML